MAQQQPSMILSMLKTPQQVRQEQLAKLREKSLAQASLLAQPVAGAQTALPGLLRNYAAGIAAEIPTDIAKATRGITRGVGGMLGAAGYGEAGKAIAGATVAPEERLAATRQRMLSGQDTTDSTKLMQIAKQLSAAGDQQGAQILTQQAMQLDSAAAQRALVQAQAEQASAKAKESTASADLNRERARQLKELFPLEKISKQNANRAQLSGIRLDTAKIKQINDGITTEEVKRRSLEQQIDESEARTQLVNEELSRYIDMSPSEVLKSQLEAAKLGVDIAKTAGEVTLDQARMADIGQTDFTRELDRLVGSGEYTKEEAAKLLQSRLETKAVQGSLGQAVRTEQAKSIITKASTYTEQAQGSAQRMDVAESGLNYLRDAATGNFRTTEEVFNNVLASFGQQKALNSKAQSQLLDVVLKGAALDKAQALKGALSDRDLAFVEALAGSRDLGPAALATLLQEQYTEAYVQSKVTEQIELIVENLPPSQLGTFRFDTVVSQLEKAYRITGQEEFASKVVKIFPNGITN